MNLSAPIHQLKRKARLLSRAERIPLHAALDRIAVEEGYRSWSLLAAKQPGMTSVRALWPLARAGRPRPDRRAAGTGQDACKPRLARGSHAGRASRRVPDA